MGSAAARTDLEAMCRDGQGVVKDSFDAPQHPHPQDVADGGVVEACDNLDGTCKSKNEEADCPTSLMSSEEIRSASFEFFCSHANR